MDQSFLLEHGSGIRRQYQTYVKVAGEWCYLYRAIDRDGTLVDVYLSETRDMAAAKAFLRSARSVTQVEPEQVTTIPAIPRPSSTSSARASITAPVSTKTT
jgi:transposase-like protein